MKITDQRQTCYGFSLRYLTFLVTWGRKTLLFKPQAVNSFKWKRQIHCVLLFYGSWWENGHVQAHSLGEFDSEHWPWRLILARQDTVSPVYNPLTAVAPTYPNDYGYLLDSGCWTGHLTRTPSRFSLSRALFRSVPLNALLNTIVLYNRHVLKLNSPRLLA